MGFNSGFKGLNFKNGGNILKQNIDSIPRYGDNIECIQRGSLLYSTFLSTCFSLSLKLMHHGMNFNKTIKEATNKRNINK